jgi:glycosyltransferase involved in cell wall biosynthesis
VQPSRDCISVGLLDKRKNHRYLLEVIAAARRRGHSYTLTLVGDGPERDDLERRAEDLGVADLVTFLGERYDVDTLLPDHRVYVHSAFMENCPFALLEAFRAALPVVAAPVGGIPEVTGGEECGLFWDLDDPESGARVLAEVLEDVPRHSRMAHAARARFESTYDAVVVGGRLSAFLDGVAVEGARVPADADVHRRGR